VDRYGEHERARRVPEPAKRAQPPATGVRTGFERDRARVLHSSALRRLAATTQVVAAGDLAALEKLGQDPPGGAKVRALPVAGAFHTAYMAPAEQVFGAVAAGVPVADPVLTLLSNADGTAVGTGGAVRDRLVAQLTRPVRWDLCQATLRELGVTALIELPPAGTLAGIARRELPGVPAVKLRTPADLPAARELLDALREGTR